MSGVFDLDIFDPDIFDCGDAGPGPVEETDEERAVTGRLSLTPVAAQAIQVAGCLSLASGAQARIVASGRLSLVTVATNG